MANATEHLLDRGVVGDHGHLAALLSELTSFNVAWCVRIDTDLEACRAPINEIDSLFVLDGVDSRVGLQSADIAPINQTARHILVTAGLLAVRKKCGRVEGLRSHSIYKGWRVFLVD